jgi:hypothetical protein
MRHVPTARSTTLTCWICGLLALLLALATASQARGSDDLVTSGIAVYDGPALDATHARLAEVLARVVKADGVDYAELRRDHRALDLYLEQLALAAEPTDPGEAKALLIDAYNAWTLALVSRSLPEDQAKWPGWSIKDLGSLVSSPWKKYRFELAGKQVTLDATENRLRMLGDPRIHVAINCASRSCPALAAEPYRAAMLDAQLDAAAQAFATSPYQVRIEDGGGVVRTNPILDWFAKDFAPVGGPLAFLAKHVGEGKRGQQIARAKLTFFDYDWCLNLAGAPK